MASYFSYISGGNLSRSINRKIDTLKKFLIFQETKLSSPKNKNFLIFNEGTC